MTADDSSRRPSLRLQFFGGRHGCRHLFDATFFEAVVSVVINSCSLQACNFAPVETRQSPDQNYCHICLDIHKHIADGKLGT